MKILFILPHPDDESFGPAPVIDKYIKQGHQVFLLTLTKGGATKQRHKLNLSIEKMGEVRYQEMLCVSKILNLSDLTVLDLPDSGLKDMDPRDIESVIKNHISKLNPDVLVTYPVHGISGFSDHLVCHAVVKRVFSEIRHPVNSPKRLAFFGVSEGEAKINSYFSVKPFTGDEIDCIVSVKDKNIEAAKNALDCYKTYTEVIEKTRIKEMLSKSALFNFFRESFPKPLDDLFAELPQ